MSARIRTEDIYDALFDDEAFETLPGRMARAIGARSAIAGWIYPDGSQSLLSHCGCFSEHLVEYLRDFAAHDPWSHAADPLRNPHTANRALDMADHVSDSTFENSALYNDLFRRIGDDTYRSVTVPGQNRWGRGCIAFHTGKSQKGFDEGAVKELDQMGRHIARMLGLRARITALEVQAAASSSMLDQVPQAALLVSATGRILHANAAGEILLARGTHLRSAGGELQAVAQSREFTRALGAAVRPSQPEPTALLLQSSDNRPLLLTVIPMKVAAAERHALLLARELLAERKGLAQLLRQLFGLTAAEAGVASMVSQGASLQQIADARAVSVATVRAQFKSVAAKMGCSRQAEVAALVGSLDAGRL